MHRTYLVLAVALCLSAGVVIALEAPRDQVSVRDSHPARASIGALPLACHAMECQDELAEQRLSTKPARSEHRGASRGDFTARQILPLSQSLVTTKDEKEAETLGGIRAELVAQVVVTPLSSWTNSTFSDDLCSKMASDTVRVSVASALPLRFLLPDCFFNSSTRSLARVTMTGVIIVGNSTWPDPVDRLVKATKSISVTSISLTSSTFSYYNGSTNVQPDWDALFTSLSSLTELIMNDCDLSGALPNSLPSQLTYISLDQNKLTGTIPATMFNQYSSVSATFVYLTCYLSRNQLNGTLPSSLLTSLPANLQLIFSVGDNRLSGTIPKDFLAITQGSTMTRLNLDLSDNLFIDTFPTNLWGLPLAMTKLSSLSMTFSNNALTGTIPSTWLSQYSLPVVVSVTISLENCNISGSIHMGVFNTAVQMTSYTLDLESNPLNSPIPASFIPDILSHSYPSGSQPGIQFFLANCGITGDLTLPTPTYANTVAVRLTIDASSNLLTSFTVNANASKYAFSLVLANNSAMTGTIDNLFSPSTAPISTLDLSNTALTGTMPFMALMTTVSLSTLKMDGVAIDFCSGGSNRTLWTGSSNLGICTLLRTSAFDCSTLYPTKCTTSAFVPISMPVPQIMPAPVPETEPSPISIPLAPITPPPKAVGCPGTQPSDEFECVNGVWTSTGTVTTPTIVITPGTSEVIVNGNVTSGTVVLQGTGSSITVTGCFTNLSVVTIQLTPEDLKKLGSHSVIELLRSDGNCSDYSTVAVGTAVSGSSCRTVKVDKATTSSGSLNGVFSVSSSGCNLWWIILVSVLAALVLTGMIVLLVVLHLRKKHKMAKEVRSLN